MLVGGDKYSSLLKANQRNIGYGVRVNNKLVLSVVAKSSR